MRVLPERLKTTEGERGVLLAALVVAVFGAGLALCVIGRLGGSHTVMRSLSYYDFWIIFSGGLGSSIGLYLGRNWFGHPGLSGWRKAVAGIFVVTFAGAICSGSLALPLYGTMFGPFSVLMTFIGNPILGVFWVATLLSAHRLIINWRFERDSIFRMPIVRQPTG